MTELEIQGVSKITDVVIRLTPCPEPRHRISFDEEHRAAHTLGKTLAASIPPWALKETVLTVLEEFEAGYRETECDNRADEIRRAIGFIRGGSR